MHLPLLTYLIFPPKEKFLELELCGPKSINIFKIFSLYSKLSKLKQFILTSSMYKMDILFLQPPQS